MPPPISGPVFFLKCEEEIQAHSGAQKLCTSSLQSVSRNVAFHPHQRVFLTLIYNGTCKRRQQGNFTVQAQSKVCCFAGFSRHI